MPETLAERKYHGGATIHQLLEYMRKDLLYFEGVANSLPTVDGRKITIQRVDNLRQSINQVEAVVENHEKGA